MRENPAAPTPRRWRRPFANLTLRERAILGLLAAALIWGAAARIVERVRREELPAGPAALYGELRAALPDPDYVRPPAEIGAGGAEPARGTVYLTRSPLPGEPEVEVSEDGWIFFPRDYYTTININQAGFDELISLPGIGPVTAWRIIRYRERYVGFSRIKALKRIRGIGDRTLEKLEGKIRLY